MHLTDSAKCYQTLLRACSGELCSRERSDHHDFDELSEGPIAGGDPLFSAVPSPLTQMVAGEPARRTQTMRLDSPPSALSGNLFKGLTLEKGGRLTGSQSPIPAAPRSVERTPLRKDFRGIYSFLLS